jgi:hypothetical protein
MMALQKVSMKEMEMVLLMVAMKVMATMKALLTEPVTDYLSDLLLVQL